MTYHLCQRSSTFHTCALRKIGFICVAQLMTEEEMKSSVDLLYMHYTYIIHIYYIL